MAEIQSNNRFGINITRTARVRGTREILSFICYICYLWLVFVVCVWNKSVAFSKEIKEHECKGTTFFFKIQIFSKIFLYFCGQDREITPSRQNKATIYRP